MVEGCPIQTHTHTHTHTHTPKAYRGKFIVRFRIDSGSSFIYFFVPGLTSSTNKASMDDKFERIEERIWSLLLSVENVNNERSECLILTSPHLIGLADNFS